MAKRKKIEFKEGEYYWGCCHENDGDNWYVIKYVGKSDGRDIFFISGSELDFHIAAFDEILPEPIQRPV